MAASLESVEVVSGDVRMVNGKPTRFVDAEEFIAAAEKAFARVGPAIDRRVKELNGYRDTLAQRVETALDHPSRKTPETGCARCVGRAT